MLYKNIVTTSLFVIYLSITLIATVNAKDRISLSDSLGTNLPTTVVAEDILKILAPDQSPSLATLVGMKKWNTEPNTYVAIACFAPNMAVKKNAFTANSKPFCNSPSTTENNDYFISFGVVHFSPTSPKPLLLSNIKWHTAENNPLMANNDAETAASLVKSFDFAPYKISNNVTAFGIRSQYGQAYAGGGATYETLTLFAMLNGKLTRVLSEPIYSNELIAGEWHKNGTRDHDESTSKYILKILPDKTNGFADITINTDKGAAVKKLVWNSLKSEYSEKP